MQEFIITGNDAGQRLDRFLGKAAPLLPASLMQKGMPHQEYQGQRQAGRARPAAVRRQRRPPVSGRPLF